MTPTPPTIDPELKNVPPIPHAPNSKLPVLKYPGAIAGFSYDDIHSLMERNGWVKGGQWKTYKTAHFHSNVHECYTVISGSCRYLLGSDGEANEAGEKNGVELHIEKDDVFILPAGVSHCAIDSEGEFEYIGFYVKDAPTYDMNFCTLDPETTAQKAEIAAAVPIPGTDPVYGVDGPLPKIWRDVASKA